MKGIDQLKEDEALRLKLYKCSAGKTTIGYGRNLEDRGISLDEAELMFMNDYSESVRELGKKLDYFDSLSDVRQSVLINMHFNLGWPKLSEFVRFLAALKRQKYALASNEMLDSKWARQVGARANRLAEMMRYNRWVD